MQPAFDKYRKLYEEDAELVQTKKAFKGCKVFDIPHLMSDPQPAMLEQLVQYLSFFDFAEFTPAFLFEMKREIPELLRLVKDIDLDWESLPESVFYHTRPSKTISSLDHFPYTNNQEDDYTVNGP